MSVALPDVVMLASSAVAAVCCVRSTSRSERVAQLLAVSMVVVMGAVVFAPGVPSHLGGAVVLLGLATTLVCTADARKHPAISLHRAAGAALMAAAVVLHHHDMGHIQQVVGDGAMMMSHGHGTPAMGKNMIPVNGIRDSMTVGWSGNFLRGWAAAFLLWTVVAVWGARRGGSHRLSRWEHATMGLSVAVMVFWMA